MEAGRQHLWDFDISPQNRQATVNAGPPIKNSKNACRTKKGDGHSEPEAGRETSEDIPEMVGEPVGEMVWWEYGLGPPVNVDQPASAKKGKGRQMIPYQPQEETNEYESDGSDDEYESNNEHVPEDEPGYYSEHLWPGRIGCYVYAHTYVHFAVAWTAQMMPTENAGKQAAISLTVLIYCLLACLK